MGTQRGRNTLNVKAKKCLVWENQGSKLQSEGRKARRGLIISDKMGVSASDSSMSSKTGKRGLSSGDYDRDVEHATCVDRVRVGHGWGSLQWVV